MAEGRFFHAHEGLLNELYDASCPDWGDIAFYRELAGRTGGPVLELGCGTGRVVWPLAAAGFEVVGVDRSAAMLARAEAKGRAYAPEVRRRVRLVRADMARFEVGERFGLAFSAFRAFQALTTPEEQRACLQRVHGALRPAGRLALHLFDPRLDVCVDGEVADPWGPQEYVHPETGRPVRVEVVRRTNDAVRQTLSETWRFTERDGAGEIVRQEEETLDLRWTYRWEMRYLLELCGFAVEAEYSDFRGSPPRYAKEQVWVARRPS